MFSFLIEEYKRSDKSKQGILNLSLTFAILKPLNISKSANLALFLLIFWKTLQQNRLTLDIWLRKKRDMQAAYVFLKSIHKQFGQHRVIVTDKAPSLGSAFRKLQSLRFETEPFMFYFFYGALVNVHDRVPLNLVSAFWKSIGTFKVKRLVDLLSTTTVSPVSPANLE